MLCVEANVLPGLVVPAGIQKLLIASLYIHLQLFIYSSRYFYLAIVLTVQGGGEEQMTMFKGAVNLQRKA